MRLAKSFNKAFNLGFENVKLDYLTLFYYPALVELILEEHAALNDVVKMILVLAKLLKHVPKITSWEQLYALQRSL
jgi:hypothetical protein